VLSFLGLKAWHVVLLDSFILLHLVWFISEVKLNFLKLTHFLSHPQ